MTINRGDGVVGEKLGSFRIEAVLGSGAMGVVYRGISEKTGKPAAIKVMASEFALKGTLGHRFEREAEILQQLRHPNIVRFLAWGKFRGTSYIAMEYVVGATLDKLLEERGQLPWREVVELGIQICEALHYAHEHGVVHRDLKPSNLMITADGKIKLADFGIAKDLDATALTASGRTLGTAAYMAPEQIRGTPAVSHKTDLYALEVVLYQFLVGKPPFEGSTPIVLMHCHLNEPPPRPSGKLVDIPRKLDDLVVSLMAKSPSDRPWDAAAVAAKLSELREKADRGAAVAMVWPSNGSAAASPSRMPASTEVADSTVASPERVRKKKEKAGSTSRVRSRGDAEDRSSWFTRATVEIAAMAAALVVIGGLIAYLVWPPSPQYLFRHAEALMASPRRADRMIALKDYIDPLDTRYPTHPYREQTQKWKDQIMLEDAENRGRALTSGLDISLTRPVNDAERKFIIAHELATRFSKRKDDRTAIAQWRELADHLAPDDPDERKWRLLAMHRVVQLENAIKDRRQRFETDWRNAETANQSGRVDEAEAIKKALVEEFSGYTDLADEFRALGLSPSSEPKTPPSAPAASTEATDREKADSPKPPASSQP